MTNMEAVNWLINLSADIGKSEHKDLWNYGQAISEIRDLLESEPSQEAIDEAFLRGWTAAEAEFHKPEQRWIPVSRELPQVGNDVMLSVGGMYSAEGCLRDDGDWWQFRWETVLKKDYVTAWMPLPKPYKGEK